MCCAVLLTCPSMHAGESVDELVFTSWFASPDLLKARGPRPEGEEGVDLIRHDIWSIGCILVFMLTGVQPFFLTREEQQDETLCTDLAGKEKFLRMRHKEWVSPSPCCSVSCVCACHMPDHLSSHLSSIALYAAHRIVCSTLHTHMPLYLLIQLWCCMLTKPAAHTDSLSCLDVRHKFSRLGTGPRTSSGMPALWTTCLTTCQMPSSATKPASCCGACSH